MGVSNEYHITVAGFKAASKNSRASGRQLIPCETCSFNFTTLKPSVRLQKSRQYQLSLPASPIKMGSRYAFAASTVIVCLRAYSLGMVRSQNSFVEL